MEDLKRCLKCGKSAEISMRFCPQCGQPFFIDLKRNDLDGDLFLDVLNSLYNLIIIPGIPDRDIYFNPISRALITKRYELDHRLEVVSIKNSFFSSFRSKDITTQIEAVDMRIASRSSNTVTGYAVRLTEELITKKKTQRLPIEACINRISSFYRDYTNEHLVADIASNMTDDKQKARILFVFFLQDDNKHMRYFLDEQMLQRWFETILSTNVEATLQRYKLIMNPMAKVKEDEISEEVLNDMVFGYCVRLSESLYPIDA